MKRLVAALSIVLASGVCSAGAQAADEFDKYAVESVSSSLTTTQAGAHTDATLNFHLSEQEGSPYGLTRDFVIELPPGIIGNPEAVPQCSTVQLGGTTAESECPQDSQVGITEITLGGANTGTFIEPLYLMRTPGGGTAARLGFFAALYPTIVNIRLDPETHTLIASIEGASAAAAFVGASSTLWGVPAHPSHDPMRITPEEASTKNFPPGGRKSSAPEVPFLTNPTDCSETREISVTATSYQLPSAPSTKKGPFPNITGCGAVEFAPTIEATPTTTNGETGSGLDFNLNFAQKGLAFPNLLAESHVREAQVTLPDGMTINPSVGEGLAVCTPADIKRETLSSQPGEGCPNASKLGTLRGETPVIDEAVDGSVYLAQQDDPGTVAPGTENPFDSLIALYLVLKNTNLGVLVKLPLKVEPDPHTGRLVATVKDIPQLPFSRFNFHFREGARSPLITPATCGTYTTTGVFTPWANPSKPKTTTTSFEIKRGVGGGPCPSGGVPPFRPIFQAGSLNNNAGSYSPFNMRLIRSDGEQDMTKFSAILPPGEIGSLVGVDKCSDAAVAIARSKTGRQELADPSCPANSLIGHTLAGAGVGESLTYARGQIYLAGPFRGDPLSVISITPAVAGPFDAGTVAIRLALTLNSKTAEVEVDGANSDPIPHILKGIVLKVRDLRVYVDRPNFTLNPTSCEESQARSTLFGSYLNIIDPSDDKPVDLSARFQAANCLNLGFKPKLALNLKGGTKRGGHPGLKAFYKPRRGDANVKGLVVRLPRTAFLDQAHIRTICTRVQFAADACPRAAQYGFIKAWTPLLDEPLAGPVWLRSSNHKLPDLVFDLHGLVDVEVATRIDSAGGGIRATVESAPDAPLTKVELKMQGGKKGLIINSRNLCGATSRANVQFSGHNGKEASANPVMRPDSCGGKRKG